MPALHDSRILFLVTNMQVTSFFSLQLLFSVNFYFVNMFSLSTPSSWQHCHWWTCRLSLPRRRCSTQRQPRWEESLIWVRFECWAVDQQTSDQRSLPLLLYFGKRNPWVRWSFKGVAPTLLSMTCKSITSHFTGQQKQGSPSCGEKRDEIIIFTFTLWGNKNGALQGAGKYGMSWSLSLLLGKQEQGASPSCGKIWDELITFAFT